MIASLLMMAVLIILDSLLLFFVLLCIAMVFIAKKANIRYFVFYVISLSCLAGFVDALLCSQNTYALCVNFLFDGIKLLLAYVIIVRFITLREKKGITSIHPDMSRQQEAVFAQMSLPEREQALAEYQEQAPRIPRWWEVVLYYAGSFALGAAVSLLFCVRII